MATESVIANKSSLSTNVIDEVSQRLNRAHAIADVLSEGDSGNFCKGTLSELSYLLMQLTSEAHELITTGKVEVQS